MTVGKVVSASADAFVEALLPYAAEDGLSELVATLFVDSGVPVKLSGVDQLSIAFLRRLVDEPQLGGTGVLQIPRSDGDSPLLASICLHLLLARRGSRSVGPVVFVSMDLDLTSRLNAISVQNRRRVGLAAGNPLSVHRLRRDGGFSPLEGGQGPVNSAFVYFNPRVGAPPLKSNPPVVVIDGRTVRSPAMRDRVAAWTQAVGAAVVVMIGDLGDTGLLATLSNLGHVPTLVAFSPDVLSALDYNVGHSTPAPSPLCSMYLMGAANPRVNVRVVVAEKIDQAVRDAYTALSTRPINAPSYELDRPLKLLRAGTRLACSTISYDRACLNNPPYGEHPKTLRRRLERFEPRFSGPWRAWGSSAWPRLILATENLWRELDASNPKLSALWNALEEAALDSSGLIAIRCHNRAAAQAVLDDLSSSPDRSEAQVTLWGQISDRVEICRFSDRYGRGNFATQILTGAPAPWHLPVVLGSESVESVILAYPVEVFQLRRQLAAWTDDFNRWQAAGFRTLTHRAPDPWQINLNLDESVASDSPSLLHSSIPEMDLMSVLASAGELIDAPEHPRPNPNTLALSGMRSCIPVELTDGRTWWVLADHDTAPPVLCLGAGGHVYTPADKLRIGAHVVVPVGEGTESVHARLLAASRQNTDVAALDLLLDQFRSAARSILTRPGFTYKDAVTVTAQAGAEHPAQLRAWAEGTTIAPQVPGDVGAVFKAARMNPPNLKVLYAVANQLRGLSRTLGQFARAIAHGADPDAVAGLRELVGPVADEVLDEFNVATVAKVGERREVASYLAGRVR